MDDEEETWSVLTASNTPLPRPLLELQTTQARHHHRPLGLLLTP